MFKKNEIKASHKYSDRALQRISVDLQNYDMNLDFKVGKI